MKSALSRNMSPLVQLEWKYAIEYPGALLESRTQPSEDCILGSPDSLCYKSLFLQ